MKLQKTSSNVQRPASRSSWQFRIVAQWDIPETTVFMVIALTLLENPIFVMEISRNKCERGMKTGPYKWFPA